MTGEHCMISLFILNKWWNWEFWNVWKESEYWSHNIMCFCVFRFMSHK